MQKKYIYNLEQKRISNSIGKAENLRFFIRYQINVSITYVCISDAKSDFDNDRYAQNGVVVSMNERLIHLAIYYSQRRFGKIQWNLDKHCR
jgi:hypothetical protein